MKIIKQHTYIYIYCSPDAPFHLYSLQSLIISIVRGEHMYICNYLSFDVSPYTSCTAPFVLQEALTRLFRPVLKGAHVEINAWHKNLASGSLLPSYPISPAVRVISSKAIPGVPGREGGGSHVGGIVAFFLFFLFSLSVAVAVDVTLSSLSQSLLLLVLGSSLLLLLLLLLMLLLFCSIYCCYVVVR